MTQTTLTSTAIPDIQSSHDPRNMVIARVGIKDVRFPLLIDLGAGAQPSVGHYRLTVKLPADKKGTHMSRFISLLEEHTEPFDLQNFQATTLLMLTRLEAEQGDIEVHFPYFIKKTAPVSGIQSLMDYEITLRGVAKAGVSDLHLSVQIPMTSLCPCSKQISDYGAHNQRSHVTIHLHLNSQQLAQLNVHQLIKNIEEQGSCELYGLLKRPDEKFVTEHAYDNPKFVEDLVRDVAGVLRHHPAIAAFTVEAENFESIHNHSAYAVIDSTDL